LVKGTSYLADGTAVETKAKCTVEFDADKFVSRCVGTDRSWVTVYAYKIVATGVYEAQIVEQNSLPTAVGSRRKYEYRVEDDRLLLTTYPQTTSPVPLTPAVKFVSSSVREGVACKLEKPAESAGAVLASVGQK